MSVGRVQFSVTKTVGVSAGDKKNDAVNQLVELPTPAEGISYDWIVQSVKNATFADGNTVQVVELKYEDDEHDLITFSTQHEVLEAIAVADASQQEIFRVYATVIVEPRTSSMQDASTAATAGTAASDAGVNENKNNEGNFPAGLRGVFAQISVYMSTLSESARESIADAVQVGIQQLKELGDPKQALLDTLAMFPESPAFDVNKITEEVKKVSSEQWEQVKAFVRRIPEQTWNFIEQSVPQLINFLPRMFGGRGAGASTDSGAAGSAFNPLAALFGGAMGGGSPSTAAGSSTASANPMASFAQFAPLMGLMSMMSGGRRPDESKQDMNVPVGVQVEVTAVDEMIQVAEPGMHVVRTWRVQNTGSSVLPDGVQVRAVVDPNNLAAAEISPIVTLPQLNPGESTEVSQLIQAPPIQGAYNIVYALKTYYGQGPSIGPDLPVELLVTEAF
eukprot:TRINITY_DN874_c0_g1_i1.p1 TRINITY_DN874_c0_g1~~TRINITY_DN874_c0_g1_i1.p1  ORF type:complete len:448 (-),score=144.56 TRINITY_DN874_c0_g1_i1:67-1410(-)